MKGHSHAAAGQPRIEERRGQPTPSRALHVMARGLSAYL